MRFFMAGLAALALTAGCSHQDAVTSPLKATPLPSRETSSQCIYQDEYDGTGCDPYDGGGGYTTSYLGDVDGASSMLLDLGTGSHASGPTNCPPLINASGIPATLYPPNESPLVISSNGWWNIIYGEMPFGYGRYEWPVGFWASITPGDGRSASIQTADAVCRILPKKTGGFVLDIDFYKYHGVEIRYPSGGGGGGNDPGSGTGGSSGGSIICTQYVEEVSYDDGRTWTEVDSWWTCT
jgi:hypothetical protein